MKNKFWQPLKSIINNLPIMLGIILLLGIIEQFITFDKVAEIFTRRTLTDTVIGSLVGSIFAGNSMNSYIIARELQTAGVSMFAITAFLVSWVTVGILQAPIEAKMFSRSFAVKRNIYSAIFSVFVAVITVAVWGIV